jgi:hypothetical protein
MIKQHVLSTSNLIRLAFAHSRGGQGQALPLQFILTFEGKLATEAKKEFRSNGGIFALWVGVLLAPVAWAAQQQALYTMVPWACQSGNFFALHAVTIAAVAVALSGALVAWRNWSRAGRARADDDRGGALARSRFFAVSGLVASLFFALVIVAQGIAAFVVHPCMF